MEAAQKLAYQYHSIVNKNTHNERHWFIARDRSYHGATLGALDVSGHKGRKAMYKPILPNNTTFISPCYPYRDMQEGESVTQYVERLAEELDSKICELGSNTVAGFVMEPVVGAVSCSFLFTTPWLLSHELTSFSRHSVAFRHCLAILRP